MLSSDGQLKTLKGFTVSTARKTIQTQREIDQLTLEVMALKSQLSHRAALTTFLDARHKGELANRGINCERHWLRAQEWEKEAIRLQSKLVELKAQNQLQISLIERIHNDSLG